MKKCRQCGFPKVCSNYFDWKSDGTILCSDRLGTKSQVAFIETGEQGGLIQELADEIDFSIDHLIINAEKNIGKLFYAIPVIKYLKIIPNNRFFRPQFLLKLATFLTSREIVVFGDGRLALDSFKAGKSAVIRYKNASVVYGLVGTSVGVYELLEDIQCSDYEYKVENGDLVIFVSHSDKVPEIESRLYLDEVKLRSGPVSYDRCPLCRTPLVAARTFDWDFSRGVITNRQTGRREKISAFQAFNAVYREIEKELGVDVPVIFYEAKKKQAKQAITETDTKDEDHFWQSYLVDMSMRGHGYPLRFERNKESITVETGITYNQVLYAARIAAGLEAVTGKPSKIDWKTRENDHSVYTIST